MSTGPRLCDVPVYLTAADASRRLGFANRNGINNAWQRGTITPAAYAGKVPLFTEEEVDRYGREQRRNTGYRTRDKWGNPR